MRACPCCWGKEDGPCWRRKVGPCLRRRVCSCAGPSRPLKGQEAAAFATLRISVPLSHPRSGGACCAGAAPSGR